VARRKPEAEHGGGEEGGHQQLSRDGERADAGGQLDASKVWHGAGELLAVRAPEPPEPREREAEHRRPAQQAVLAVEEEGHQAIGAVEVAGGEGGVGGALAGAVGGVGGGAAVEGLVETDVEGGAEEGGLDRADGEGAAAGAPEAAGGEEADYEAGGDELGAEPGKEAEQDEAEKGVAARDVLVQP